MFNQIKVVFLDRTPERFAAFKKFNRGLPIEQLLVCEDGIFKKKSMFQPKFSMGGQKRQNSDRACKDLELL